VSSLTEIVGGLADQLKTIAELDQNVLTVVRRPATYPAAIIVPPPDLKYGTALDGKGGQFTLNVLVLVAATEAEGQATLWPFLDWAGPSSIPAAVNAEPKLGLGDVNARVVSAVDPGLVELPDGSPAYGITLNVLVFAS